PSSNQLLQSHYTTQSSGSQYQQQQQQQQQQYPGTQIYQGLNNNNLPQNPQVLSSQQPATYYQPSVSPVGGYYQSNTQQSQGNYQVAPSQPIYQQGYPYHQQNQLPAQQQNIQSPQNNSSLLD